jgi:hypothetical protein
LPLTTGVKGGAVVSPATEQAFQIKEAPRRPTAPSTLHRPKFGKNIDKTLTSYKFKQSIYNLFILFSLIS